MPDVLMILGWFAHMFFLAGVSWLIVRKLKFPWRDWPFVIFVVVWADLVLASQIASLFGVLNRLDYYIYAALASLLIIYGVMRRCNTVGVPLVNEPRLDFISIEDPVTRKRIYWFLGVTFALTTFFALVVVTSSYPDNADSIIYRLPRVFWYVSNGSFKHPFDAIDKRLIFYPLDGVALYIPIVLYALPGVFHNFPSPIMWLAVAYASYRFARSFGAERLIAAFAAWIVAMTPNVMAQSVSTNDEIICAAALLVGVFMGWRWITTGMRGYLLLMTTAFGLSVGTKLHIVFLSPIIIVGVVIAIRAAIKDKSLLRKWGKAIGWTEGGLSIASLLIMVVPFLFYNYVSTGRWYFLGDFASDVFNLKSSLQGAFQNLIIYTSQMIFSPLSDLNVWPYASDRQAFCDFLNGVTNPLIMPFVNPDRSFFHAMYKFTGVTIPVSVRFLEFSLWAGFAWTLWPFTINFAARCKDFALKPIFILFAATPLLWLLLWSASTLYMEGTATYFSFYLTVAAPAAVAAFLHTKDKLWNEMRWAAIVLVAITNTIIISNIYIYSGFRSVTDIVRTEQWPFDWLLFDRKIVNEIRNAEKMRIVFTHEKMPYFSYMRWNPMAIHYDPYRAADRDDKLLNIIPASSLHTAGMYPVKVPGKQTAGATFIGLIRGIGREAVFAIGNGVEKRYPDESDYILFQFTAKSQQGGIEVSEVERSTVGYDKEDNLEYRYEIKGGDKVFFTRDWSKEVGFKTVIPYDPGEYQQYITISVRSAWSHKEMAKRTYQLFGPGAWLPDGPEY